MYLEIQDFKNTPETPSLMILQCTSKNALSSETVTDIYVCYEYKVKYFIYAFLWSRDRYLSHSNCVTMLHECLSENENGRERPNIDRHDRCGRRSDNEWINLSSFYQLRIVIVYDARMESEKLIWTGSIRQKKQADVTGS